VLGVRYSDYWAEENLESTGDSDTDGACPLAEDEKEALDEDMRKERHLMRRRMKLPLSERRQVVRWITRTRFSRLLSRFLPLRV
jgi:hypothetical protein